MLSVLSPSPIPNRHRSVIRRRHKLNTESRTVRCQGRRHGLAAASSSTSFLPPTPCKSFQALRRLKRHVSTVSKLYSGTPNKKRRLSLGGFKSTWISRTSSSFSPSRSTSRSSSAENGRKFFRLGVIGSGSFCTVFKVKSAESNDIYALKKCTTFLRTKLCFISCFLSSLIVIS